MRKLMCGVGGIRSYGDATTSHNRQTYDRIIDRVVSVDTNSVTLLQSHRVEARNEFLNKIFGLIVGERVRRIRGIDEDLVAVENTADTLVIRQSTLYSLLEDLRDGQGRSPACQRQTTQYLGKRVCSRLWWAAASRQEEPGGGYT